jgi:hypothetical protein
MLSLLAALLCPGAPAGVRFPEVGLTVTGRGSPQDLKIQAGTPLPGQLQLDEFQKILAKVVLPKSTEMVAFYFQSQDGAQVTTPVVARYEGGEGKFVALLDLGDPLMIQPYSGQYALQLIVGSSDNKTQSYQADIASARVSFSRPLTRVEDEFSVLVKDRIQVQPPPTRPPAQLPFIGAYTSMVALVGLSFAAQVFRVGINWRRIPKSALGLLLNLLFLGCLCGILYALAMFWLSWSMIDTLQVLAALGLLTLLVGNFAMLHRGK